MLPTLPIRFSGPDCYTAARAADDAYRPLAVLKHLEDCWPFESRATDTQGFIREQHGSVVLAFRGTTDFRDWLTDCRIRRINVSGRGIHAGFQSAWESVRPKVIERIKSYMLSALPLIITGHSLGGALAAIAALDLEREGCNIKSVYTFGQPRVGDYVFQSTYNFTLGDRTFRIVNSHDPVPWLPGALLGYRHHSNELLWESGQCQVNPPCLSKIAVTLAGFITQMRSHFGPAALALALNDLRHAVSDHSVAHYRVIAMALSGGNRESLNRESEERLANSTRLND